MGDGCARTQLVSPYRASFWSFYAHASSSGCGIPLAFKAFRVCAFECSGSRSIYQGCCFALLCAALVALFQCSSYRQFDIACQQRTRAREVARTTATTIATTTNNKNNNNGKVNTQSTKHLFTAITEIFLHSTWNWKRSRGRRVGESSLSGHVTFLSVIQSYAHAPFVAMPEVLLLPPSSTPHARHVKVSSK